MKNIVIAGNVTRDAVLRDAGSDKVLGFSVAVNDGFGQNRKSIFFDCDIWGKRAVTLQPMLAKGQKVTVCGDLSTREHNGKTYLTIRVNDVTLQGSRQNAGDDASERQEQRQEYGQQAAADDLDDDLPF